MKKLTLLSLVILVAFTFNACSSDDDNSCTNQNLEISDLEANCLELNEGILGEGENYIVISSQEEFEEFVSDDCDLDIDFTSYDLVIGQETLTNGLESTDYELIQNCETDNLTLNVTFNTNVAAEAPLVTYYILIPKLSEGQEVDVQIEIVPAS